MYRLFFLSLFFLHISAADEMRIISVFSQDEALIEPFGAFDRAGDSNIARTQVALCLCSGVNPNVYVQKNHTYLIQKLTEYRNIPLLKRALKCRKRCDDAESDDAVQTGQYIKNWIGHWCNNWEKCSEIQKEIIALHLSYIPDHELSPEIFKWRLQLAEKQNKTNDKSEFIFDRGDPQAIWPIQNFMKSMEAEKYTQCLVDVAASDKLNSEQQLDPTLIYFPVFQELAKKKQEEVNRFLKKLLHIYSWDGSYPIRRLLYANCVQLGADLDLHGDYDTMLGKASAHEDEVLMRMLIQQGATQLLNLDCASEPIFRGELLKKLLEEHACMSSIKGDSA